MSTHTDPNTFPPLGQEPFNLPESETIAIWGQPTAPVTEAESRRIFRSIAGERFDLYPEITMRSPDGHGLRIDFVGKDKADEIKGLIGFELKSGTVAANQFTDFSKSVAQCIDYRHARIETDIFGKDWFSKGLKYIFMFPCVYKIYEHRNTQLMRSMTQTDWWAQGVLKLAGKFGVGAISYDTGKSDWGCFLGGHPAYWMKTGATVLAQRHAQGEHIGSGR